MDSTIIRWYRTPAFTLHKTKEILSKLKKVNSSVENVETEICYHVEFSQKNIDKSEISTLEWILRSPINPEKLTEASQLKNVPGKSIIIECGPRFNFSTSDSSNAVSICHSLGLKKVTRLEVSKRYLISWNSSNVKITKQLEEELAAVLHDRMTECQYTPENIPKRSFNERLVKKEDYHDVNVMGEGRKSLEKINVEMGLAFDERDLEYYTNLFTNVMKRNPTTVECFDLAQSNSEHSRHWFFKGKMVIDGKEYEESLIDMIIKTQETTNPNNVIKFSDNSSAIKGYSHESVRPVNAGSACELKVQKANSHLIFTAETHNFPTGVAPFSGATTGTGGRIRDVEAVGRGGYCIAGTAGYSVGNLLIPGYDLPWEDSTFEYPNNFASPLDILVEASNGASDYGNKFGEPVICGFARSFGLKTGSDRREWIKPIMFSAGLGTMEADMVDKLTPEKGMQIVKIGGPVYRIGVGGGAASSVEVQGDNKADLDFNAVQRGDAEMEQKLNRVVRACLEMGDKNPIVSIHDQGAGGNGNVLKELVEPTGGVIYANRFDIGDPTINALELWGAEYQETNALLCRKTDVPLLKNICKRERCPVNFVGEVTDTGRVVLALDESMKSLPVNLDLEHVLGKMPRKVFVMDRQPVLTNQLQLPSDLTVGKALERVLRLPSVSSKRYLTNKVDRCVTGMVAQQQCVGPLHTPLADVAVTAVSHFGYEGIATAIGEQPIKGLVNTGAGARMTVGESVTNLVFAAISEMKDIKCSGNWMWAAKLPGEGAALYDACVAMCDLMRKLGIAIDGGKDSLSMAARVGKDTIKAPGTLVVSTYAPCPDVRKVVTPDLKAPANKRCGVLLYVDLSNGKTRLGGSALAQCYKQLGNDAPDVDQPDMLVAAFNATQKLIKEDKILSGHDVSDGGLITCLLEMAFAGMCGLNINITYKQGSALEILFAEELGWVLEVDESDLAYVQSTFKTFQVPVHNIGQSTGFGLNSPVVVSVNKTVCLQSNVLPLMKLWEETSYQLEFRQTMRDCVESEFNSLNTRTRPTYKLTFDPDVPRPVKTDFVKVAVLREEGTNGDREMAAAFLRVGFTVWDITMQDLISGVVSLDQFRGLIFPGGFSYADVLGSAKGWAAGILFNETIQSQFKHFLARKDTFSLGVCNGCQLMGLMGWVGYNPVTSHNDRPDVVLEHNLSEKFECRWSTIRIEKSRSIMLKGMEGSAFGVWIAHGEGRFTFSNDSILKKLEADSCVGLRYVDDNGNPTEVYPMNPNGSVGGLAGICSADGRHLAMMPHPERCDQMYLWPWAPSDWSKYKKSPWERMFQNAYDWCQETH